MRALGKHWQTFLQGLVAVDRKLRAKCYFYYEIAFITAALALAIGSCLGGSVLGLVFNTFAAGYGAGMIVVASRERLRISDLQRMDDVAEYWRAHARLLETEVMIWRERNGQSRPVPEDEPIVH